jgi:chromosome partitioning protein
MGSGIDKHHLERSSCEVLLGDVGARDAVQRTPEAGYDVLPANADLTAAEVGLMNIPMREKRLDLALSPVKQDYDYILVDCPPSLNMLTLNALVAADGVLIPIQTEYYALEGLTALMSTIEQIRGHLNQALQIEGFLRTMHDPRNNLAVDVSGQLLTHFKDAVFNTIIPRNVRVAEAPSFGIPILLYDKNSRGAMAYLALASELLRRHRLRESANSSANHEVTEKHYGS